MTNSAHCPITEMLLSNTQLQSHAKSILNISSYLEGLNFKLSQQQEQPKML